jgi:hypothetical protein
VVSGNMENYEVASYNMLGEETLLFLSTLMPIVDNRAYNEYQKVIKE